MEPPKTPNQKAELASPQVDSSDDELIKEICDTRNIDFEKCNILYVKPLLNIINIIFSGAAKPHGIIKVIKTKFLGETNIWSNY